MRIKNCGFLPILGLFQALLVDFQAVFGHYELFLIVFWSFSGDFKGILVILANYRSFSGTLG